MAVGYLGVGNRNGETLLTTLLRNHLPLDILPRALAPSAFFPAFCVSTMTPWLSLQGLSEPLLTVGWAGDLVSEFLTAPFPLSGVSQGLDRSSQRPSLAGRQRGGLEAPSLTLSPGFVLLGNTLQKSKLDLETCL